uniref:CASPASE_P20 domain-containing protein n=1 Tax=Steinernema glaseri TaxID=37863 RepID=A0A1I8AGB4_9BILA
MSYQLTKSWIARERQSLASVVVHNDSVLILDRTAYQTVQIEIEKEEPTILRGINTQYEYLTKNSSGELLLLNMFYSDLEWGPMDYDERWNKYLHKKRTKTPFEEGYEGTAPYYNQSGVFRVKMHIAAYFMNEGKAFFLHSGKLYGMEFNTLTLWSRDQKTSKWKPRNLEKVEGIKTYSHHQVSLHEDNIYVVFSDKVDVLEADINSAKPILPRIFKINLKSEGVEEINLEWDESCRHTPMMECIMTIEDKFMYLCGWREKFKTLPDRNNDLYVIQFTMQSEMHSANMESDAESNGSEIGRVPMSNVEESEFILIDKGDLDLKKMRSLPLDDEEYLMFPKDKGHVLIINNIDFGSGNVRSGSAQDEKVLRTLFKNLGFTLSPEARNLSAKDMEERVKEFAESSDHINASCAFVIVLTHGNSGVLKGSDGNYIKESTLLSKFSAGRAKHLIGKPKIFIFQACRGDEIDTAHTTGNHIEPNEERMETDGYQEEEKIPGEADFLVFRAVADGYKAFRLTKSGSWFIQTICRVFDECARSHDVLSMCTKVNSLVSKMDSGGLKQMPEYTSRLRKILHLFPPQERTTGSSSVLTTTTATLRTLSASLASWSTQKSSRKPSSVPLGRK